MGRPVRSWLGGGIAAIGTLCCAGPASADVWETSFVWFPVSRWVWEDHTLGSGRIVELRTDGDALQWNVDSRSQSGRDFRRKQGAIELHAPDHCAEIQIYTEALGSPGSEALFDRVERGTRLYDVPTRADLGDVAGRWRAFVARGPLRPPQPIPYDSDYCEAIRSQCDERDLQTRMAQGFGSRPEGYSIASPRRIPVPCELADAAVDRCVASLRVAEAEHVEALARYEPRMRCFGLAVVARSADVPAMGLEIVSAADGAPWGRATAEPGPEVDVSAWAYAPLTVVADVLAMALNLLGNLIMNPWATLHFLED